MSAEDSKALQETLNEAKITQMLQAAMPEVFEKFQPTNSEMVVFALCVIRMMMERAVASRTGYPAKMNIGTPAGHTIWLEIKKPTTDSLQVAKDLMTPPLVN